MTQSDEMALSPEFFSHEQYDSKHIRVILTKDQIASLPIMEISKEAKWKLMCGWYWNGLEWYPNDLVKLDGEAGYDDAARYVVK